MYCHVYYSSLRHVIYKKIPKIVIGILLLEVAKIIDVYSKAVVEYDCNRMRQI